MWWGWFYHWWRLLSNIINHILYILQLYPQKTLHFTPLFPMILCKINYIVTFNRTCFTYKERRYTFIVLSHMKSNFCEDLMPKEIHLIWYKQNAWLFIVIIFVEFCRLVYQQKLSIIVAINCTTLLTYLLLYSSEAHTNRLKHRENQAMYCQFLIYWWCLDFHLHTLHEVLATDHEGY